MQKYNIGILLFNGVEVLDFAGPFEVFSVTSELSGFNFIDTFTVGVGGPEIMAKNGLRVVADYNLENHPKISILVVPGGDGTKKLVENMYVTDWVKKVNEDTLYTTSVCSGARLLAKAGLLDKHEATTHHEVFEDIKRLAPTAKLLEGRRFVHSGKIITAGGISAGIDMSLYLVKILLGEKTVVRTKKYMEYGDWDAPSDKRPA